MMDEYSRNLVISFLQEVIDKSVINDEKLTVEELKVMILMNTVNLT